MIPNVFPMEELFREGFYDSCLPLTTRGIWQQRGVAPRRMPRIALIRALRARSAKVGPGFASDRTLNYQTCAGSYRQTAYSWRIVRAAIKAARIGTLTMPQLDFRKPRLFVDAALAAGETVALERSQSNYLGNVLGSPACGTILVFNGRDGEWHASILGRKRPDSINIVAQTRPQDRLPDLAYVFAPLKHARLDYMVQKAVEMGASSLQPVLTRFTQVSRVNGERMRANVIEAAEQCGILSIADVAEPVALERYLAQREGQRLLVFCDEAAEATDPLQALRSDRAASTAIDVLIGPEGGFAEEERNILLRQP